MKIQVPEMIPSAPVSVSAPVPVSETAAIISMIERAARDPAVDIDKLQRLFELQAQVQSRAAKGDYLAALSAMQSELPTAVRRGTAHNNKRYARFEDVVEAMRPSLKAHGFSLTYRIRQTSDRVTVIGVLGHAGGHSEETEITLPADASGSKNPVQAWASSVSYGKRYVALTLTGIATDDDDDGQAAGGAACITEDQQITLRDMLESVGGDAKAFCKYFKIASLADLPSGQFDRAVKALEKKAAQK